jgi:hypothetical protein
LRGNQDSNDQRGNWYLLTGLVIGLVLGVLYSWVISPVKYVDTDPSSLAPAFKDEYRQVIALAYHANGNLERARERLSLIDTGDVVQALAAQAQRMVAENQPPEDTRMLAVLAADLGAVSAISAVTSSPQAVTEQPTPVETETLDTPFPTETATLEIAAAVQTPTVPKPTLTPAITRTPMPTFTPRPTATPMRSLDAPFALKSRREVCDGSVPADLLQLRVTGADDEPLPGVNIIVTWQGGENVFYTGLAPEIDPGYADFRMQPGIVYTVQVGEAGETINNISIPSCKGGVELVFGELNSNP